VQESKPEASLGQQQLLLIILGVIIVGVAVYVGIALFADSSIGQNRAAMRNDLTVLAQRATEYYMKPKILGGGGRSFEGLDGDAGIRMLVSPKFCDNENGTYNILTAGTQTEVVFHGVGKKALGDVVSEFDCRVTPTGFTIEDKTK
jgi:hypothetical protein